MTNPQPHHAPGGADSSGHDASRLSRDRLEAFVDAYLNNRVGEVDRLRQELAAASLPPETVDYTPALWASVDDGDFVLGSTRAVLADQIVSFLTDASGDYGNRGSYIDPTDEHSEGDSFTIDNTPSYGEDDQYYGHDLSRLVSLVRAYVAAAR